MVAGKAFGDIFEKVEENSFFEADSPEVMKDDSDKVAELKAKVFKYNDVFPDSVHVDSPGKDSRNIFLTSEPKGNIQNLNKTFLHPPNLKTNVACVSFLSKVSVSRVENIKYNIIFGQWSLPFYISLINPNHTGVSESLIIRVLKKRRMI